MKKFKRIYFILITLVPLLVFITAHFTMNVEKLGVVPTGFFNGEASYYMANARQYVDHGFTNIFYGNPFSYLESGQRVYFQFQTFILAILLKATPFSVGTIWLFFGLFLLFYILGKLLNCLKKWA